MRIQCDIDSPEELYIKVFLPIHSEKCQFQQRGSYDMVCIFYMNKLQTTSTPNTNSRKIQDSSMTKPT